VFAKRKDIIALFFQNTPDLDRVYLRDIVVNLMIAGRDTTAQSLTWLTYNLSRYPQVQELA